MEKGGMNLNRSNRMEKFRPLLFLLLAVVALLINYAAYPQQDLLHFGYTPVFTAIADSSLEQKAYVSTIEGMTNGSLSGPAYQNKIPETQREPLYPAAIMAIKLLGLPINALIYIQMACLVLALGLVFSLCAASFGLEVAFISWALACFSPICFLYTQILYPYAFSFLGIVVTLYFLRDGKRGGVILAALGMACAIYERGMFLFLPIVLAAAFIFSLRPVTAKKARPALLFLFCSYLLLSPWLVRDYALGFIGMNEMSGYAMGYTYGRLPYAGGDMHYETSVAKDGTDGGSLAYIGNLMLERSTGWAEADKYLAHDIVQKIIHAPLQALKIVGFSISRWDLSLFHLDLSALTSRGTPSNDGPITAYYKQQVPGIKLINHLVFLLFLIGLWQDLKRKERLAYMTLGLALYTLGIASTFVLFDPRYRGPLDGLIFLYAAAASHDLWLKAKQNYGRTKPPV